MLINSQYVNNRHANKQLVNSEHCSLNWSVTFLFLNTINAVSQWSVCVCVCVCVCVSNLELSEAHVGGWNGQRRHGNLCMLQPLSQTSGPLNHIHHGRILTHQPAQTVFSTHTHSNLWVCPAVRLTCAGAHTLLSRCVSSGVSERPASPAAERRQVMTPDRWCALQTGSEPPPQTDERPDPPPDPTHTHRVNGCLTCQKKEAATSVHMQMRASNASDLNLYLRTISCSTRTLSALSDPDTHTHSLSKALPDCETHLSRHESNDECPRLSFLC